MKFNIDDYKGRYAMHCKTKEEAIEFLGYMEQIGRPLNYSARCCCGEDVSFFNNGTWCSMKYAIAEGYTILEWEDFMNKEFTKGNLKTGDVVLRRNGNIEIVNRELGMLICSNGGWDDLDDIQEDLTARICGEQWDIVEVRRPRVKSQCCFNAMKYKEHYGDLVYERKEVEEMTLAEVCKLLGKEIKIVK